jgi:hypothetical protein
MRFPERCYMALIAGILALQLVGCAEDEASSVDARLSDPYNAAISGTFATAANPPMSEPPLPCVVAAVSDGRQMYILTVEGSFFCISDVFEWEGRALEIGEQIIVEGTVEEHLDIRGGIWVGIEVESIQ